jgi:hypothetical protein
MKKSQIFLFITLLVVFISACESTTTSSGRFIGGNKGLEISFIEQEPPSEVLDNREDEFDISLRLRNVGEAAIPAGRIVATLNGINKVDFSLSSLSERSEDERELEKGLQNLMKLR